MEIRQDENEYKHLRLLWTAFFITAILVIFLSFFLMTHSFDLSDNTESFLLNLIWILFVIFFVFAWLKTIKREWRKSFKYYVNSEIDFTAFIKIKETALRKKIESYSKNSTWAVVEKVVEQALKRGVDVIVVYKFYANGKEFVNAKSYDKLLLKEIPKIGDKIKIKYSSFDPRLSGIYHKIISKKTGWIAVQKLTFEVSEE